MLVRFSKFFNPPSPRIVNNTLFEYRIGLVKFSEKNYMYISWL